MASSTRSKVTKALRTVGLAVLAGAAILIADLFLDRQGLACCCGHGGKSPQKKWDQSFVAGTAAW
jgi:hypothetical protein